MSNPFTKHPNRTLAIDVDAWQLREVPPAPGGPERVIEQAAMSKRLHEDIARH